MPGAHGGGCGCRAEDDFIGAAQNLLPWIDVDNVIGLNEDTANTAKTVFRPYDDRLDDTKFVESPADDMELIIKVPFTSPVKVMGLTVIGGGEGTCPNKVVLYTNREDIDFGSVADLEPTQELPLFEDFHGAMQYPLRAAKFITVTQIALYFPTSFNEEQTRIHWIGLWGQGSQHKRQAVQCVYEAVANPSEKQVRDEEGAFQDIK